MFEEVMDVEDANFVAILSEQFNSRRVFLKIYFNCEINHENMKNVLMWIGNNYSSYLRPGIRVDLYEVCCGRVIGH